MPAPSFASLRDRLRDLADDGALVALKTGTEVEDMSFEEIRLLRALSDQILPLAVKIGGPEARNDIREITRLGADCLIAPMIESAYALENFVRTLQDVLGPVAYDRLEKGINLETVTALRQLREILGSEAARELDQTTAARSDLSASLHLRPDDDAVFAACAEIIGAAREAGLRTSVGGGIHANAAGRIAREVAPDTVNTRHMTVRSEVLRRNAEEIIAAMLDFERELYVYLAAMPSPRQAAHAARANLIAARLGQGKKAPHPAERP